MENPSVSLSRQVLDLISKREFEEMVMRHNGDRRKPPFNNWAHSVWRAHRTSPIFRMPVNIKIRKFSKTSFLCWAVASIHEFSFKRKRYSLEQR